MKISPWVTFLVAVVIVMTSSLATFGQIAPSTVVFTNNLLPQPADFAAASGQFVLSPRFSIGVAAFHDPRLDAAIYRTVLELRQKTGIALVQRPLPSGSEAELVLAVRSAGQAVQSVDEDESYALTVTASGVRIEAATVVRKASERLRVKRRLERVDNLGA